MVQTPVKRPSPPRLPVRLRFAVGLLLLTATVALYLHRTAAVAADAQLLPVRERVAELVKTELGTAGVEQISVYYYDLNHGPAFGINEDFRFAPASLMKVPVMVAYLKRAESDPQLLQQRLLFRGAVDYSANQGIAPRQRLVPGQSYTTDELIERMIAYSDNNALSLLLEHIDLTEVQRELAELHIDYQPTASGGLVSMRSYANVFRALYDSSYLSPAMSARALQYLAEEDFRAGIIAGVPQGTKVAGKFGEWAFGRHSEIHQLQECGVVYAPSGAYLLGVSVQGRDTGHLSNVISHISQAVYHEVTRPHRPT